MRGSGGGEGNWAITITANTPEKKIMHGEPWK